MPLPTLSETKHFLRVDHNEDDGLISSLLIASKTLVEEIMRTTLDSFDEVPEPVNQAVLILVGTLYEERQISKDDRVGVDISRVLKDLSLMLFPYRKENF